MAELIAREIATQFFGVTYDAPPVLTVPRKKDTPPPEPVRVVPDKFLHLRGAHAPHPGTGKGKSYQNVNIT